MARCPMVKMNKNMHECAKKLLFPKKNYKQKTTEVALGNNEEKHK